MRDSYVSYPVELPVQYQTSGGNPITGQGRTLQISRETVRFECDQPLPLDHRIQLVITWPARLPDGTRLNLWVLGTITDCTRGGVAVWVGSYEFKTGRDVQRANLQRGKRRAPIRTMTAGS